MQLTPLEPGKYELGLAVINDTLTYDCRGQDQIIASLSSGTGGAWTASAVFACELAFDEQGLVFEAVPAGAVAFSAFGTKPAIACTGATAFRIRNTTTAAGSVTAIPIVSATRSRP